MGRDLALVFFPLLLFILFYHGWADDMGGLLGLNIAVLFWLQLCLSYVSKAIHEREDGGDGEDGNENRVRR